VCPRRLSDKSVPTFSLRCCPLSPLPARSLPQLEALSPEQSRELEGQLSTSQGSADVCAPPCADVCALTLIPTHQVLQDPAALASLSTGFLSQHEPALAAAASAATSRRSQREQQAFGAQGPAPAAAGDTPASKRHTEEEDTCTLSAPAGAEVGVYATGSGQCVSAAVTVGDIVRQGAPLLALSVMKMEHLVRAPISAKVIAVLAPGERASSEGLVAVLDPSSSSAAAAAAADDSARGAAAPTGPDSEAPGDAGEGAEGGWGPEIATMEKMRLAAQAMGGSKGVARQKAQGKKTARERIALVLLFFCVFFWYAPCLCTCVRLRPCSLERGGGGGGGGGGGEEEKEDIRERDLLFHRIL